jgi:hypothetical protein
VSTADRDSRVEDATDLEERAAAVRAALLHDPAFLDLVRRSEEDIAAGRFVSMAEIERKYLAAE